MNSRIIIIGGLHHNTLGVIRSLGEAGITKERLKVIIVEERWSEPNIISESRYVDKNIITYLGSYNDITPWLLKYKIIDERSCIICCSDGSAENVMKNATILNEWYNIPSTSMDAEILMSKSAQNEIAIRSGFNVPESIVVKKNQREISWVSYPCITKPLKSIEGAGKADIIVINKEEELQRAVDIIEADEIEIQKYIKKEMEYQLIGCSLDSGNIIIIPGYTRIIRQPSNTNTGYLKYSPISELNYNHSAVQTFIKTIGYSGLFSMEFIRGSDGNDYFLEINMRNDGNAYCVQSAGVNLPYLWCFYQFTKKLPENCVTINKSVFFMPDFFDIKMGIKSVGLIRWVIQFFGAKSHSLYNLKDMNPFFLILKKYLKIYKNRLFSR